MLVINTVVAYVPAPMKRPLVSKYDWSVEFHYRPAHWHVMVDFIEDGNAMSASMHDYVFACKPTRKQLSLCKRKALAQHQKDLAKFKQDYPHYF